MNLVCNERSLRYIMNFCGKGQRLIFPLLCISRCNLPLGQDLIDSSVPPVRNLFGFFRTTNRRYFFFLLIKIFLLRAKQQWEN